MLKHNLILIYRNFRRYKSTFFINLIGLAAGLACAIFIYLWMRDELLIDKFHKNDKHLFQVMANMHTAEGILTTGDTPSLLSDALKVEIPEIKYAVSATNTSSYGKFILSTKIKNAKAVGQFVDKDFFNVFSYELLHGNKDQVLADKNSIILSEQLALKLFTSIENSINKNLEWELEGIRQQGFVSGVFKGTPSNSSDQFDFLLSHEKYKDVLGSVIKWSNYTALTYVVLHEAADIKKVNASVVNFIKNKVPSNITLFLKPYSQRYLYGSYENGAVSGGRIVYIKLFSAIAFLILIIACINFMNLSTAKASGRVKEVGIKKVVGASRNTLVVQYLTEAILITLLSLIVAIAAVQLLLPQFNSLIGKHLTLHFSSYFMAALLAIVLVVGLIAGSYPALYLSGFNPAAVLKGKLHTHIGELLARKGLVIFQFSISIILIVAVIVVYKQITFMQTKSLGYNKENIVYFEKQGALAQSLDAFLAEMKSIPGIVNASSINHSMVGRGSYTTGLKWKGKEKDAEIRFERVDVNYDLLEALGITMREGRSFSKKFGTDSSAIILNEAAVQAMGLSAPVGKVVNLWGKDRTVIGVAKNFHFESLHENVRPLFFKLRTITTNKIMARIKPGEERKTLSELEKLYKKYNPDFTFEYKFLDESYQALYVSESRISVLSRYFGAIAILISCLGLFGLAAFTAERRKKEIGIRKVLGSGAFNIIYLLSSDFTKLVFVSIIIALPISYVVIKQWLNGFAYRIDLQAWYFIVAGLIALSIAWLTVSAQAIKAARANPVNSLRTE